jgi:hypothetical protein
VAAITPILARSASSISPRKNSVSLRDLVSVSASDFRRYRRRCRLLDEVEGDIVSILWEFWRQIRNRIGKYSALSRHNTVYDFYLPTDCPRPSANLNCHWLSSYSAWPLLPPHFPIVPLAAYDTISSPARLPSASEMPRCRRWAWSGAWLSGGRYGRTRRVRAGHRASSTSTPQTSRTAR